MPPPRTRKDPLIGKTIAGCRFMEKLGRGRTGNVYRAQCASIQKVAAVKVLRGAEAQHSELREAFLREARAIAALDHENIVKIFDVLETEDTVLIVMELLDGPNVWEMLIDGAQFSSERAARITAQVARALTAAHRQKLIHRDVKPQNVIVLARDRVKVVDFGLAALPGSGGDRVGTPHYMAPEQASRGRIDTAVDVYSLGATLYHMLTGRTPYQGKTVGEILKAHKEGKLVAPRQLDAMISKDLDRLAKQMMAPAKGYRPSAEDVVKTLDDFLAKNAERRGRTEDGAGASERPRRGAGARGRTKSGAGALLGGFLALIGILAIVLVLVLVNNGGKSESKKNGTANAGTPGTEPAQPTPEEDARARNVRANADLDEVKLWIVSHRKDREEAMKRLEAVATKHPGTAAARQARKRAGEIEEQIRREQRPKRQPTPVRSVDTDEIRKRFEICRKLMSRLRVEDVDGKLKVLARDAQMTVYSEKVALEIKALEHVKYLRDSLIYAVSISGTPIPYKKVDKACSDATAMIVSADGAGFRIKGEKREWVRAWTDLTGDEVLGLAETCLQKKPDIRFALGVFLVRADRPDAARHQFEIVKMIQRGSRYSDLIEKLGK